MLYIRAYMFTYVDAIERVMYKDDERDEMHADGCC